MYPDPILPKAHPDLLQQLDYDPFNVMPAVLPDGPRISATAGQIRRARERIEAEVPTDRFCYERLLASAPLDQPLPAYTPTNPLTPDWGGPLLPWLKLASTHAMLWHLNDDQRHRDRAIQAMRLAADSSAQVAKWTGSEHHEAANAAAAYDLLTTAGLDPADDNRFREMLWRLVEAMDLAHHHGCNNHNAMQMDGRLSLGTALGHRGLIHDTLYGCQRQGRWRYGLIHLLRHDFLPDGIQWEGTVGYHFVVMTHVSKCFAILENLGVNLWHRSWPATVQNEGIDEHRGWGPKGDKTMDTAFDAILYQAFTNGDYSQLHDEGIGNLRGTCAWTLLFNTAWTVFGYPRYAWALQQINLGRPIRADGPIPVWFDGSLEYKKVSSEFVRWEEREYPEGQSPFLEDRKIGLTGKYVAGCSLFPTHGSAVLRSDVVDQKSLGAHVYWGPHWAGHRSPAALSLDIHALGQRVTEAPHRYQKSYFDPRHLAWNRSTIAHNTVCIDHKTMFPYDFPTQSSWECDTWRDRISDGVLESFQSTKAFKAVRASNDNVYPGVKLDRTVVIAAGYLLDVYRVHADEMRQIDWAMHCQGDFSSAGFDGDPVELSQEQGYQYLTDAREHRQNRGGSVTLSFGLKGGTGRATIWLDGAPDSRLIMAKDPLPDQRKPVGDLVTPEPRACLMVRSRAKSAVFVSVWDFDATSDTPAVEVQGSATHDITVQVRHRGQTQNWQLPLEGEVGQNSAGRL